MMNNKRFIVDAHLDLAMNALEWNRDLRRPVPQIREREKERLAVLEEKPDRGRGTVSLPAMRRGSVGLCVATQIARYVKPGNELPGWHSPQQAWAMTQGQLAWYRAMEEAGEMVQIRNSEELERHLGQWENPTENSPIGYILSLEGADSLITPEHLERSWEDGLRAIGPAHYGPGTYAQGTNASGGIGARGRELLKQIERLNLILDATHLCDDSFRETMDCYGGPVWASHSNCRALVPDERQFTDDQIKELVDRGAVIGMPLDAWMMVPGWVRGESTPEQTGVTLEWMIDHIDHICQLAGNSLHVGIGSDLDGGFGKEQCPADLETIADLQKIPDLLENRGYGKQDVQNILHENWIRFLRNVWD